MSGDRLAQIAAIRPINKQDSLLGFVSVVTITEADRDALVEIAKAARVAMASVDDTDFEDAVIALRLALARLDSGATEGDA